MLLAQKSSSHNCCRPCENQQYAYEINNLDLRFSWFGHLPTWSKLNNHCQLSPLTNDDQGYKIYITICNC